MSSSKVATGLAAAGLVLGCGTGCTSSRPYRPVEPHRAATANLEAEIVWAQMGGFRVVLRVRGGDGAQIARALLAPSVAAPCSEGVRDRGLTLDDHPQWIRPVAVGGEHVLAVDFPELAAADLLQQEPSIDLVLPGDAATCLRLPLSGRSAGLAWERPVRWSASWAARLVYPLDPVASVNNGWTLELGAGRWIGPVRVRVELGGGAASCSGDCPTAPDGPSGFGLLAVRSAVDGYLWQTRGFGVAAEVGYAQLSAFRTNPDHTSRWQTNIGPRAALRLDLTSAPAAGWEGGGKQSSFGFELGVGELYAVDGASRALVIGIGIVNHVGFLATRGWSRRRGAPNRNTCAGPRTTVHCARETCAPNRTTAHCKRETYAPIETTKRHARVTYAPSRTTTRPTGKTYALDQATARHAREMSARKRARTLHTRAIYVRTLTSVAPTRAIAAQGRPAFAPSRTTAHHGRDSYAHCRDSYSHGRDSYAHARHPIANDRCSFARNRAASPRGRASLANDRASLASDRTPFAHCRGRVAPDRAFFAHYVASLALGSRSVPRSIASVARCACFVQAARPPVRRRGVPVPHRERKMKYAAPRMQSAAHK